MFWSSRNDSAPRMLFISTVGVALVLAMNCVGFGQTTGASAAVARAVGAVKSIDGNQVILTPDSGPEVSVLLQDTTRILRTAPGQTSLKDATAMPLQELQVGDRLLVKGTNSSDGKTIVASTAIVMKKTDVAARQEQQKEDWQKNGVAGIVKAVVPASGAIDISVANFAGAKNITLHTTKSTVIRRYAPESVKFDDAKPGMLEQIKVGDQLRAKGKRSDDGTEVEADEIVSGTFRNIAGTVSSIDAGQNTIGVMDLISKKMITVKIGSDSQVRQLPAMFAQRIAIRLKGGAGEEHPGGAGFGAPQNGGGPGGGGPPMGGRPGGTPNFQQMLSRLPAASLADIHKGDAVIIVTTEGTASSAPTAITMLSGVEPLLSASPDSSRASTLLSPWNLGASPGGDGAAQ